MDEVGSGVGVRLRTGLGISPITTTNTTTTKKGGLPNFIENRFRWKALVQMLGEVISGAFPLEGQDSQLKRWRGGFKTHKVGR